VIAHFYRAAQPGFIVLAAIAGVLAGVLLMYVAYQPLACS
jgi:hypothetical protein